MNQEFKSHLINARASLIAELEQLNLAISAIDNLLAGTNGIPLRLNMVKAHERRKGGVKQVLQAIQALETGTIREIANKIQELFPVENEIGLLSKVATYLKRLENGGDVTCDNKKPKKYTLNKLI